MSTPIHVPGPGAVTAHAARWDLDDALKKGTATLGLVDAYITALLDQADYVAEDQLAGYDARRDSASAAPAVTAHSLIGWPDGPAWGGERR